MKQANAGSGEAWDGSGRGLWLLSLSCLLVGGCRDPCWLRSSGEEGQPKERVLTAGLSGLLFHITSPCGMLLGCLRDPEATFASVPGFHPCCRRGDPWKCLFPCAGGLTPSLASSAILHRPIDYWFAEAAFVPRPASACSVIISIARCCERHIYWNHGVGQVNLLWACSGDGCLCLHRDD